MLRWVWRRVDKAHALCTRARESDRIASVSARSLRTELKQFIADANASARTHAHTRSGGAVPILLSTSAPRGRVSEAARTRHGSVSHPRWSVVCGREQVPEGIKEGKRIPIPELPLYVRVCVCACVHVARVCFCSCPDRAHSIARTRARTHMLARMHAYACTHTHARTHAHTHARMHARACGFWAPARARGRGALTSSMEWLLKPRSGGSGP